MRRRSFFSLRVFEILDYFSNDLFGLLDHVVIHNCPVSQTAADGSVIQIFRLLR